MKGGENKMEKDKLNAKRVAFSLASVIGIAYIVCVILVVIAPETTIKFFSYLFHGINIEQIPQTSISFSNVIIGLIEAVIYSLLIGWLFAVIYNKIK